MAFPTPNPYDEPFYSAQQHQHQGPQVQQYQQHDSPSATSPGGASSSSSSTPLAYQGQWDFGPAPLAPAPPGPPTLYPAVFSPHEPYGAVDFAPPPGPPPPPVAEAQHHSPAPPAMIRLEEKEPLIPKEIRTRSRARVEAQQAASGSSTGSPSTSGGVSRTAHDHERPSPYSRPQPSGSGSGKQKGKRAAGGEGSRPSTSARRVSGSPMSFSPEEVAESSASVGGSHSAVGAVGGGDLSPVMVSNVGQPGMSGMSPPAIVPSMSRTSAPRVSSPLARIPPVSNSELVAAKVYSIRSDVLWNVEDEELVVEYETPGVKMNDIDISLARDPYSQAVQLIVQGRTVPRLAEVAGRRMHLRRERNYGDFRRIINVPPTTTANNVSAVLQDGVLTIRVPLPASGVPQEPPQVIQLQH